MDEALLAHPSVAQAVTFAVPHAKLGEEVAAAVVAAGGSRIDERELRRYLSQSLAAFKVPRRILVLDELPKGPTGKLQRIGLAERLGLAPAADEVGSRPGQIRRLPALPDTRLARTAESWQWPPCDRIGLLLHCGSNSPIAITMLYSMGTDHVECIWRAKAPIGLAGLGSSGTSGTGTGHRRLVDRFELHVIEDPEALACVEGAHELTRAEVWLAAGIAATDIRSAAGCHRQVVVLHLPDSTAWQVMFLAVLRAGHVPASVPITATVEDLVHTFKTVQPALVLSVARHREASPVEAVLEAASQTTGVAVALVEGSALQVLQPAGDSPGAAAVPEEVSFLAFVSGMAASHSEESLAARFGRWAERFELSSDTPLFMPDPQGPGSCMICGTCLSMFLGAPLICGEGWHGDAQAADHGTFMPA